MTGRQKLQQRKVCVKSFSHYFMRTPNSAVFLNSQLGEVFKTTLPGCLLGMLTLTFNLFNLLLDKFMQGMRRDHHKSISIGGRPICNLQFANDIDLMNRGSGEF